MSSDNLGERARTGFKWSLIGNYGGQVIGFAVSVVLARLLSPEDFGIVGMSLAVIEMLKIGMSLGLNEALVQKKDISNLTYSSVFFVNIAIGILVTLGLLATAPLIANYYGRVELKNLVRILSIIYLLESFNVVQNASLRRTMDFKLLAVRGLSAQILAGVIAMAVAFAGYGLYALVVQHIVMSAAKTVLIWRISSWRPKWEFSWRQVKDLWGFAMYSFFGSALQRMILSIETFVYAKVFSPLQLGYYSRAQSFSNLLAQNSSNSIRAIMFPALSRMQHDSERFNRNFLRTYGLVSSVSVIIAAFAFINGEVLVVGIFGEKWQPVVPIFLWLTYRIVSIAMNGIIITTLLAKGFAKQNFYYAMVKRTLGFIPLIVMTQGDLLLFLQCLMAVDIVNVLLSNYATHSLLKLPFWKLIQPLLLNIGYSVMLILIIQHFIQFDIALIQALVTSFLYLLGLAISFLTFNRNVLEEFKLVTQRFITKKA